MKIHSIYKTVSGEVGLFPQGAWVTIVRLDGCNLRCPYCDTKETQQGDTHKEMDVHTVVDMVESLGIKNIMITGGEPLLQMEELVGLCAFLTQLGNLVQIETNGSIFPTMELCRQVHCFVVDYKLPSTGQEGAMMSIRDFELLPASSMVKFVCTDRWDYERAKEVMDEVNSGMIKTRYAMSAASPLHPSRLFSWMLTDRLFHVLFNVQIHKLADIKEKE